MVLNMARIACMLQGSWFNAASLIINGLTPSIRPSSQRPFRFVRLVRVCHPGKYQDSHLSVNDQKNTGMGRFSSPNQSCTNGREPSRKEYVRYSPHAHEQSTLTMLPLSVARLPALSIPVHPTWCPNIAYRSYLAN